MPESPNYSDFHTVQSVFEHMTATLEEREGNYDHPMDNFNRIARVWNWYLEGRLKTGDQLTAVDVGMLCDLMKTARFMFGHREGQPTIDHILDKIGYMVCLIRAEAERLLRAARPSDWSGGYTGKQPPQTVPLKAQTANENSGANLAGVAHPVWQSFDRDRFPPTYHPEQSGLAQDQNPDVQFVEPLSPEWHREMDLAEQTRAMEKKAYWAGSGRQE